MTQALPDPPMNDPLTLLADLAVELADLRARLELVERRDSTVGRRWLTVAEAGELLGCSPDAIRMRVKRGRLKHDRQGRRLYISADAVEQLR